jgi:hypothetical protein
MSRTAQRIAVRVNAFWGGPVMKRLLFICIFSWFFSIALISSSQAMQFAVISDVREILFYKVVFVGLR